MWPELREAQRRALGLASTAMAVTIDIGEADNIHPANKQEVGRRLALAARAVAYGEKIEYSGPLFRQALPEVNAPCGSGSITPEQPWKSAAPPPKALKSPDQTCAGARLRPASTA
jgi:hypothetical protein